MRWKKLGRIFDPQEHRPWAGSHAQVPTVRVLDDRLRIFYADRTPNNKSFATWIDVDRADPARMLGARRGSVMEYGSAGAFDDEGIMPGDTVERDGGLWMYYTGWNQGVTVPYRNSIGLAVSDDGGSSFRRMFDGPIVDRNAREPLMAVTPILLHDEGCWKMWYVSGTRWVPIGEKLEPVYVIKYAESDDGIEWRRSGATCVPQRHDLEAHAHPSVIRDAQGYHMWFCYRDSTEFRDGAGAYRIGYAFSRDGLQWDRRDDEGGLGASDSGWDSTMTCYPYVVRYDGATHMFYNGNGFGRSGIGHAVLEER